MNRKKVLSSDSIAKTIDNYNLTSKGYVTDPFEYIDFFEKIKNKQKKRLLVVGTGPGDDAATLKKIGFTNIVGIDLAKGMVAEAHKRHPDIEIRHVAMQEVGKYFEKNEFDIICSHYSLFHVQKSELKETLKAFTSVLKPSGFLYITTQESMKGKPYETYVARNDDAHDVYINAETEESLKKLLSSCGFQVVFFARRNPREEEHQFY